MADQLQTNFASDLRNILKCVFLMNSSQTVEDEEPKQECLVSGNGNQAGVVTNHTLGTSSNHDRQNSLQDYEDEEESSSPANEQSRNLFFSFFFFKNKILFIRPGYPYIFLPIFIYVYMYVSILSIR